MGIYMPYMVSKMYIALFAVGVAGIFLVRGTFCLKESRFVVQKKNVADDIWKIKTKVISKKWSAEGIFHILMVLLLIIPVILFMDYVYYNDNQAQGRYLMPALYPLMYFVTLGWNRILTKVVKNEKVRSWIYQSSYSVTCNFSICMLGFSYSTILCRIMDETVDLQIQKRIFVCMK